MFFVKKNNFNVSVNFLKFQKKYCDYIYPIISRIYAIKIILNNNITLHTNLKCHVNHITESLLILNNSCLKKMTFLKKTRIKN